MKQLSKMKILRATEILLLIIGLIFLTGLINARIVRLKTVEIGITDLDPRLEGTTIAFISDLNIYNGDDAARCAGLVRKMCASKPDMLIIGGGITAPCENSADRAVREKALETFMRRISNLRLEGGIFIVYSHDDLMIPDAYLRGTGCTVISGGQLKVWLRGAALSLVGYDGAVNARRFAFNDEGTGLCIVVSNNPKADRYVPYITDRNGRPYADLILSGMTLGGQVRIFGKSLVNSELNQEYPDEITSSLTIPMVVSSGIGTRYLPFRLGAAPSAYIIKLVKGES